jgi:hypothetical protein
MGIKSMEGTAISTIVCMPPENVIFDAAGRMVRQIRIKICAAQRTF